MEEGVRADLAASSLALLQVPATQPLLVRARLVRIRAGSVTAPGGRDGRASADACCGSWPIGW